MKTLFKLLSAFGGLIWISLGVLALVLLVVGPDGHFATLWDGVKFRLFILLGSVGFVSLACAIGTRVFRWLKAHAGLPVSPHIDGSDFCGSSCVAYLTIMLCVFVLRLPDLARSAWQGTAKTASVLVEQSTQRAREIGGVVLDASSELVSSVGAVNQQPPRQVPEEPPTIAPASPEGATTQIIAELQEQNRLLRLEREERQAEKHWAAEREKRLQAWASLQANNREKMDKIEFESDKRQAEAQASVDALRGNAKMLPLRFWEPTYGKWYPKYLEEYRKVCGTMTKDELRNFAKENSLPWDE